MMKFALAVLATLTLSVSVAFAADWENVSNQPILNKDGLFSSIWLKKEEGQHCILAVRKDGSIEATIFRGSILQGNDKGSWHIAEYMASGIQFVKKNGLVLAAMYGPMPTGMEMTDLNAFKRQCDGLPPI